MFSYDTVRLGTRAKDPQVEANLKEPTRSLEDLQFCHIKR